MNTESQYFSDCRGTDVRNEVKPHLLINCHNIVYKTTANRLRPPAARPITSRVSATSLGHFCIMKLFPDYVILKIKKCETASSFVFSLMEKVFSCHGDVNMKENIRDISIMIMRSEIM